MIKELCLIVLVLLASSFAQALVYPGYSGADSQSLPVYNIYDPYLQKNMPITRYSFEELDEFMRYSSFHSWNEVTRVCDSMQLLFGIASQSCTGQYLDYHSAVSPRTARAYVSLQILPRAADDLYLTHSQVRQVLLVDPIYPPWSPTYNPYW